jgi:HMG (high mobility group) box
MMKQLGKIWSNLSKEERKSYEDVAKKDKDRYEKEMKNLTGNGRTIEILHEVEHKRPKKWLSAYMIFVREVRSKISKANPDMPVLQIMKEVGSRWQSLIPSEKNVYQQMADEDKVRYKQELKEFEKEVEKLPTKGRWVAKNK